KTIPTRPIRCVIRPAGNPVVLMRRDHSGARPARRRFVAGNLIFGRAGRRVAVIVWWPLAAQRSHCSPAKKGPMSISTAHRLALLLVPALLGASATGAGAATPTNFAAGTLIVPMDVTYQDGGMLKAFGLVDKLL